MSSNGSLLWEMSGRMSWKCEDDGKIGEYRYIPESGMYEWRYSSDGELFDIGFCDDMTEAMLIVESKFRD